MFGNAKILNDFPYSTAIERVFDDVLFDLGQPCAIKIFPLNAFSARIATITLRPMFAQPIFHHIVTLTKRTVDVNRLFHLDCCDRFLREVSFDHVRLVVLFVKHRNQRI